MKTLAALGLYLALFSAPSAFAGLGFETVCTVEETRPLNVIANAQDDSAQELAINATLRQHKCDSSEGLFEKHDVLVQIAPAHGLSAKDSVVLTLSSVDQHGSPDLQTTAAILLNGQTQFTSIVESEFADNILAGRKGTIRADARGGHISTTVTLSL